MINFSDLFSIRRKMASAKRYKKFLVAVILLGITTVFMLKYEEGLHLKTLVVEKPKQNGFVVKRMESTRPVKIFFSPPAPLSTRKLVTGLVNNLTKTVEANMTKVNIKTLYPITIDAPYLIENPKLCSSVPDLAILVIVHTAPGHFERRNSIRYTWTNETYFKTMGRVRVLFLLGKVKDINIQKKIEQEFVTYGDLLQGDFIDAYRNLSHKGVMAYKWISERCRNAQVILKVDDDVIVDTYTMMTKYLPMYKNKTKNIFCNHILAGTMPIIRKNTSKWHVDENLFKGQKFYPRYCSGYMVMFTNDFIPALYRSASVTPFFWVDDVYLYGLVPSKVPGIKYNGLKQGDSQLTGQNALKCYKNVTRKCNFLVTGAGTRDVMTKIWSYMTNNFFSKQNSVVLSKPKP